MSQGFQKAMAATAKRVVGLEANMKLRENPIRVGGGGVSGPTLPHAPTALFLPSSQPFPPSSSQTFPWPPPTENPPLPHGSGASHMGMEQGVTVGFGGVAGRGSVHPTAGWVPTPTSGVAGPASAQSNSLAFAAANAMATPTYFCPTLAPTASGPVTAHPFAKALAAGEGGMNPEGMPLGLLAGQLEKVVRKMAGAQKSRSVTGSSVGGSLGFDQPHGPGQCGWGQWSRAPFRLTPGCMP